MPHKFMENDKKLVLWFKDIKKEDVPEVGGKSANLGEMTNYVEVPVPPGFSTTSYAFNKFLDENNIREKIEQHYKRPMDIEWARDEDGKTCIWQILSCCR